MSNIFEDEAKRMDDEAAKERAAEQQSRAETDQVARAIRDALKEYTVSHFNPFKFDVQQRASAIILGKSNTKDGVSIGVIDGDTFMVGTTGEQSKACGKKEMMRFAINWLRQNA